MTVLHSIHELLQVPGPVYLAIGVFDGVHIGHRAVIGQAQKNAQETGGTPVVVSFDPHPDRVLRPDKVRPLLTSTEHKAKILHAMGLDWLLLIRFDQEFSKSEPESFVRHLSDSCRPLGGISVGKDWAFGHGARGNVELLESIGKDLGFRVDGIAPVAADGEIVSSTRIRRLISGGHLEEAEGLLGRPFSVLGRVEHGSGRGHEIGFPTANLETKTEQFPPNGVYAISATVEGHGSYPGVANLGVRPTFEGEADGSGEPARLLEVHLFSFHNDLYGSDVEVTFVQFLRPEQKFAGVEQLKAQIIKDVSIAKGILQVSKE